MIEVSPDRLKLVARTLIENSDIPKGVWPGIQSPDPTQKEANKFFLGAILDFQIKADKAWENAERLSEKILGDPENLWEEITKVSLDEWNARKKEYALHRFPAAHQRVYTIGQQIVRIYQGDARNIWKGHPPNDVFSRLDAVGVRGQIARMIVGALMETGQIDGKKADVKADLHVRRVLGRILCGRKAFLTPEDATEFTRKMNPDNPWLLDQPLFGLGSRSICTAKNPQCTQCYMESLCQYRAETRG